jgi:PAP2 superfamily
MSKPANPLLIQIVALVSAAISRAGRLPGRPDEAEALAVRQQFRFNWLLIGIVMAIFDLCLLLTDFHIRPLGYLIMLAIACVYGLCGSGAAAVFSGRPRVLSMATAFAQALLAVSVLTSLSYIAIAAALPLQDARLFAVDRAIGFDFRAVLNLVNDRVWLIQILAFGYNAITWQMWLVVLGLPLIGHHRRTAEYVSALTVALAVACCVTMLMPAIGAYQALGAVASEFPNVTPQSYYDTLIEIPLLRAGTLRTLDLWHLLGVVTFPSFHAATAVLYSWALWPLRWARPLNLALNGTMLVATPICGGHYLVDVLAGVALAIGSIYAARHGARIFDMSGQTEHSTIVAYQV